jgi:hypothetical protein
MLRVFSWVNAESASRCILLSSVVRKQVWSNPARTDLFGPSLLCEVKTTFSRQSTKRVGDGSLRKCANSDTEFV